ncbi:MAG: hypothetical protein FJ117_22480 [Deltaproteobacteria bacterium]|nr:hypothetical protein [Deltaproteobacteria bacterium]
MKLVLLFLFCGVLTMGGCYYTLRFTEGTKISAAQMQEIKLGKTTELDLIKILGPPSKKETKLDGTETLIYIHFQIESPTLPGGVVLHGFLDKDREEIFEVILKNGVVQSFHFLKP